MTRSYPEHCGEFAVSLPSGEWSWSDRTFELLGFAPGEVVPGVEVVLPHVHPGDRDQVRAFLAGLFETGTPAALWHRVVDARGVTRQLVVTAAGEATEGPSGGPSVVRGYVVDVTEPLRRTSARVVDEALEQISQSRAVIEQAKGALMLRFGLDADEAFALLRGSSQQANVKLRDVAGLLLEAIVETGSLPVGAPVGWEELADQVRSGRPAASTASVVEENPGA